MPSCAALQLHQTGHSLQLLDVRLAQGHLCGQFGHSSLAFDDPYPLVVVFLVASGSACVFPEALFAAM